MFYILMNLTVFPTLIGENSGLGFIHKPFGFHKWAHFRVYRNVLRVSRFHINSYKINIEQGLLMKTLTEIYK